MDNTQYPAASEFKNSTTLRPEVEASSSKKRRRRSMAQKVVVRVKVGEGDGRKRKSEGPPSDSWSWRKYGQKPIKGSPHPRGYYRCSTSKGCSAKKQVERSRTDASVLIITYTSTHNHPAAAPPTKEQPAEEEDEEQSLPEDNNKPTTTPVLPEEEEEEEEEEPQMEEHRTIKDKNGYEEDSFHYSQSPFNTTSEEDIIIINPAEDNLFTETLGTTTTANYDHYSSTSLLLADDGEPLSYPHLMDDSTPKSQENDFYDELEELSIRPPHPS